MTRYRFAILVFATGAAGLLGLGYETYFSPSDEALAPPPGVHVLTFPKVAPPPTKDLPSLRLECQGGFAKGIPVGHSYENPEGYAAVYTRVHGSLPLRDRFDRLLPCVRAQHVRISTTPAPLRSIAASVFRWNDTRPECQKFLRKDLPHLNADELDLWAECLLPHSSVGPLKCDELFVCTWPSGIAAGEYVVAIEGAFAEAPESYSGGDYAVGVQLL